MISLFILIHSYANTNPLDMAQHSQRQRSNCFKVHPDTQPGPCCHCGINDISQRYIHLIQKKDNPSFCDFVQKKYNISDTSCICRKCESQLKRAHVKCQDQDCNQEVSAPKKSCPDISNTCISEDNGSKCFLHYYDLCDLSGDHSTKIEPLLFQKTFNIDVSIKFPQYFDKFSSTLCHKHYNAISNSKTELRQCVVCEKSSRVMRYITLPSDKHAVFSKYLSNELSCNKDLNSFERIDCCHICYNGFNSFCRSDSGEDARFQTDEYLMSCLQANQFTDSVSLENIDIYSFQEVFEFVIQSFLQEQPVIVPHLFEHYKESLDKNISNLNITFSDDQEMSKLRHNTTWLIRMLKNRIGRGMSLYVPKKKQSGTMLYRSGMDFLNYLYSSAFNLQKKEEVIVTLKARNEHLLSEKNKPTVVSNHHILNEAFKILKKFIKIYISDRISSPGLPDIHSFSALDEIRQIPPVLWNFIYRLSSTEKEDKDWMKHTPAWDHHFIDTPFNASRMIPRLFYC